MMARDKDFGTAISQIKGKSKADSLIIVNEKQKVIAEEIKKLLLKSKKPSLGFIWLQKIVRLEEIFPELYDKWWESEETGDMTAVEEYLQERENQIRRDTARINNEADTLYRNMNDREIEEAVRILDSLSQNTNIELVPLPSPNQ